MKRFMVVLVALLLCVSCSAHKVTDPALSKPSASGTPVEGDGGGDPPGGGVPEYLTVALNPSYQLAHPGDIVGITLSATSSHYDNVTWWDGAVTPGGFDAYEGWVDYDTTRLVCEPLAPMQANMGGLMVGTQTGANGVTACGSVMCFTTVGPGYDQWNNPPVWVPAGKIYLLNSLACWHLLVDAPGDIWHLRFRVKDRALGNAAISLHDMRFTNGIGPSPNPGPASATVNVSGVY